MLALARVQQPSPASALTGLCESTRCAFPLSILSLVHSQRHVGEPQGAVTSPGSMRVEEGEEKKNWTNTKAINKSPLLEPCAT